MNKLKRLLHSAFAAIKDSLLSAILFFQRHVDKVAHFGVAYFLQDMILMLRNITAEIALTSILFVVLFLKEGIDKKYRGGEFSWPDIAAGLFAMILAITKVIYIIHFAKKTFSWIY